MTRKAMKPTTQSSIAIPITNPRPPNARVYGTFSAASISHSIPSTNTSKSLIFFSSPPKTVEHHILLFNIYILLSRTTYSEFT